MAYKTGKKGKWVLIATEGSRQVFREECSYFQLADKRNQLLAQHPSWHVRYYFDLS